MRHVCVSCLAQVGDGGVQQEDGKLLCFACDQRAHIPEKTLRDFIHECPGTAAMVGLNLLVFLLALPFLNFASANPDAADLLNVGATTGANTRLDREFWRLFSSMFLHAGADHLLANTYVLLGLGVLAEEIFGWRRFIAIYLLAGLGGGLASMAWNPGVVSVGASGAIFGVLGAILACYEEGVGFKYDVLRKHKYHLLVLLGFNLVSGFVHPHIDNAAHLGGLLLGWLAGLGFQQSSRPLMHTLRSIATVCILAVSLSLVYLGLGGRVARSPLIHTRSKLLAYNQYVAEAKPLIATLQRLEAAELDKKAEHNSAGIDAGSATQVLEQVRQLRAQFEGLRPVDPEVAKLHNAYIHLYKLHLQRLESTVRHDDSKISDLRSDISAADTEFSRARRKFFSTYRISDD